MGSASGGNDSRGGGSGNSGFGRYHGSNSPSGSTTAPTANGASGAANTNSPGTTVNRASHSWTPSSSNGSGVRFGGQNGSYHSDGSNSRFPGGNGSGTATPGFSARTSSADNTGTGNRTVTGGSYHSTSNPPRNTPVNKENNRSANAKKGNGDDNSKSPSGKSDSNSHPQP